MSEDNKAPSAAPTGKLARSQKLVEKLEQDPDKMAVAAAIIRRAQIDRDLGATNEAPGFGDKE